jgi:putative ABC transport system permease protein
MALMVNAIAIIQERTRLNLWLVQAFNLTPLAWYMIPSAMLVLWVAGQAAVYAPARRASHVSSAIATRTV